MTKTPVEIKKTVPARTTAPDVWRSFRGEMDRLFDHFSRGFELPSFWRPSDMIPTSRGNPDFDFLAPAVDVSEDEKAYKIAAELPGLDAKNVDISVSGDILTLSGEKQLEKEEKQQNYVMSERAYGSFQRSFYLPDGVNRDKIAAEFSKGVLTITLPKTAEAQKPQKRIEIKAAA